MTWDASVRDEICARIAEGESLRAICRDEKMPGVRTVFDWLERDAEFRTKYVRAREVQAEMLAGELIEIADDGKNDWMERRNSDGDVVGWAENGEALRRSQLRVATRQWVASKLLPKVYGDKQQIEHSGSVSIADTLRAAREKRRGAG